MGAHVHYWTLSEGTFDKMNAADRMASDKLKEGVACTHTHHGYF